MRKRDLKTFGVAILLTLLSALFVKGSWGSVMFLEGIGRGFPFYWYRYSSDGVIYINVLAQCLWSFLGDALFWFTVLVIGRVIIERTVKQGEK